MPEEPVGCAKPTGTVIDEAAKEEAKKDTSNSEGERRMVMVRVDGKAPDFEAHHNLGLAKMEIGENYAGKNRRSGRKNLEVAERKGQGEYITPSQIFEGD